jgi:hypothetical protein
MLDLNMPAAASAGFIVRPPLDPRSRRAHVRAGCLPTGFAVRSGFASSLPKAAPNVNGAASGVWGAGNLTDSSRDGPIGTRTATDKNFP